MSTATLPPPPDDDGRLGFPSFALLVAVIGIITTLFLSAPQ